MEQTEIPDEMNEEIKRLAARRATERARVARWDLNVAVFLFAVLIIVIILLFQGIEVEVVTPVAVFGLSMVWLVGWRQGRKLYQDFFQEEMEIQTRELMKKKLERKETIDQAIEETVEEKVQKALRERWH